MKNTTPKNMDTKTVAKQFLGILAAAVILSAAWPAYSSTGNNTLSSDIIPVIEVTVFKDGHAFVLHEGTMPCTPEGNVRIDYLPQPVIGTFWAYSALPNVKLAAVVSEREIVPVTRTALSVRQLIEANVGKKVLIRDNRSSQMYEATIIGIPAQTTEELEDTSPPGSDKNLPKQSDIVMLRRREGIQVTPLGYIEEITFLDDPATKVTLSEFRNRMTLKLDRGEETPKPTAKVGLVYLQKGIRWIPSYRIEIDDSGKAHIKLQGTIVNDLTDLEDVKAHLVVGVPSFAFKDIIDPISLQETIAQVASQIRGDRRSDFDLSNAIMSQMAGPYRQSEQGQSGQNAGLSPELSAAGQSEDLYIFTIEHITLKKGARMVVPIADYTLKYEHVYTLDIPFAPPAQMRQNMNTQQQMELAKLFYAPKVRHVIRLANDTDKPITTAPALIVSNGRIICQGMTKYTSTGSKLDLELTTAVNISADCSDVETGRTPDAQTWNDHKFSRTDLAGKISLVNHTKLPVRLEVSRSVLGTMDGASQDGQIKQYSGPEGLWKLGGGMPSWWGWSGWPNWWLNVNPAGKADWNFTLESEKTIELEYTWHYFWRY